MINSYYNFFNGDKQALKVIIDRFSQPLFYFIFNFVKDEFVSEDILEDVFLAIIVKKRIFKNENAFKSYLFSIARNKSINYIKRSQSRFVLLEDKVVGESGSPENMIEEKFDVSVIQTALKKLSSDYYAVIYLSYFEELKNPQIAKIMKKSTKQVENLLFRAKAKLKNILTEDGYEKVN